MKLIDAILEILNEKDPISISELQRRLKKKGISVHRLFLSGYAHCLSDLGRINLYSINPVIAVSLKDLDIEKLDSSHLVNRRK